jgi:hypothetical protein
MVKIVFFLRVRYVEIFAGSKSGRNLFTSASALWFGLLNVRRLSLGAKRKETTTRARPYADKIMSFQFHFQRTQIFESSLLPFSKLTSKTMKATKMQTRERGASPTDQNNGEAPSGFILKLWQMIDAPDTDVKVSSFHAAQSCDASKEKIRLALLPPALLE